MKIKYLGTAAAEGFPAVFCDCEKCRKAWKHGGKNIRGRSQAIVDNKILIDFPVDTFSNLFKYNINLLDINHCLISHIHGDHLFTGELNYLQTGFSHPPVDWEGITFYGSEDLGKELEFLEGKTNGYLHYQFVQPYVPFKIGDYTVTALKACHGTEHPYIYMISDGNKTLLYGHDTDIFPEETWNYLKENQIYFNLVSLDCTEGAMEKLPYQGHMCLGINCECRKMMYEAKLADEETMFVLNHFSHNGMDSCYDDFYPIAQEKGFEVSYDGMEVEI